jgi:hypothetical protein
MQAARKHFSPILFLAVLLEFEVPQLLVKYSLKMSVHGLQDSMFLWTKKLHQDIIQLLNDWSYFFEIYLRIFLLYENTELFLLKFSQEKNHRSLT